MHNTVPRSSQSVVLDERGPWAPALPESNPPRNNRLRVGGLGGGVRERDDLKGELLLNRRNRAGVRKWDDLRVAFRLN